jgi:hypothetical protein
MCEGLLMMSSGATNLTGLSMCPQSFVMSCRMASGILIAVVRTLPCGRAWRRVPETVEDLYG